MKYRIVHIENTVGSLIRATEYQQHGKDMTVFLCQKVQHEFTNWNEFNYKIYRLQAEQLDGPLNIKVNGNLRNYLREQDVINLANYFDKSWKEKEAKENSGYQFIISTEDNANSGNKLMNADNAKPEHSSPNMLPRRCSEALTMYYVLLRNRKDENSLSIEEKQEEKLGDNVKFLSSMIFND